MLESYTEKVFIGKIRIDDQVKKYRVMFEKSERIRVILFRNHGNVRYEWSYRSDVKPGDKTNKEIKAEVMKEISDYVHFYEHDNRRYELMMYKTEHERQVDLNYIYFESILDDLMEKYEDKYVILKNQSVVEVCDNFSKAFTRGKELYGEEGCFSVQEVTKRVNYV